MHQQALDQFKSIVWEWKKVLHAGSIRTEQVLLNSMEVLKEKYSQI